MYALGNTALREVYFFHIRHLWESAERYIVKGVVANEIHEWHVKLILPICDAHQLMLHCNRVLWMCGRVLVSLMVLVVIVVCSAHFVE